MRLKSQIFRTFPLLVGCFVALACSRPGVENQSQYAQKARALWQQALATFASRNQILVTDENGQGVSGAQVLIGTALNAPFSGNFLVTGADGSVAIPEAWKSDLPVTIQANHFHRVTFFAQTPGQQKYILRAEPAAADLVLTGVTPGITPVDESDECDFSLVIPALQRQDILNFSVDQLVSPDRDTITVFGRDVKLPANITIPKQTQDYIFAITLDKPLYRLHFQQPGVKKVFALHGQFPFKATIDAIRGGQDYYTLLNSFSFLNGGLQSVEVQAPQQTRDIPVTQFQFDQVVDVHSPAFASDEAVIAAALKDENGYLMPTDAKLLTSGGVDHLRLITGATESILTVLKKQDELKPGATPTAIEHLSATILPIANGVSPQLLPMLDPPTVANAWHVQAPHLPSATSVFPIATYGTLARVVQTQANNKTTTTTSVLWEVYAPKWVREIQLPAWPNEALPSGSLRWALAFLGGPSASQVDLGPELMQTVTHVTKSATDFE